MSIKKYYYKIQSNVELLWVVGESKDPLRPKEKVAEFFVNSVKFETRTEGLGVGFSKNFYKELESYHEIKPNQEYETKAILYEDIGLVRITHDRKYFMSRHLVCFNKIVIVGIFADLNEDTIAKYFYLLNLSKKLGDEIYQKSYEYYKMSGSDEYFQLDKKMAFEDFCTTIELQEIYIDKSDFITVNFRPSWDEEHGLFIKLNIINNDIEIEY